MNTSVIEEVVAGESKFPVAMTFINNITLALDVHYYKPTSSYTTLGSPLKCNFIFITKLISFIQLPPVP